MPTALFSGFSLIRKNRGTPGVSLDEGPRSLIKQCVWVVGLVYGPQSSTGVGGRVLNTELPHSMTPTPPVRNLGHGLVNWVCHKVLLYWDLCGILRVWRRVAFRSDGATRQLLITGGGSIYSLRSARYCGSWSVHGEKWCSSQALQED